MRKYFKYFVWFNFWLQIKLIKLIKRPYIVLIIGGSKKSLVRQKIFNIIKTKDISFNNWYRPYNTWFGVALNFLDLPSAYSNYKKWVFIYILSWIKFFKHLFTYPKYIFLEGGIDSIGESKKFISLLNPHIIIFTSSDHIFQDDFDLQTIIEKEFFRFVEYLNKKAYNLPNFEEKLNYYKFIENIILQKQEYIGVFSYYDSKIDFLYSKLKRKITLYDNMN